MATRSLASAMRHFAIGNVKIAGDSCGFGSGSLTGVSRADLAIGQLGDHGGCTATIIPGADSVVIDAGNNFGCLATDQRGAARPSGLRCHPATNRCKPVQTTESRSHPRGKPSVGTWPLIALCAVVDSRAIGANGG